MEREEMGQVPERNFPPDIETEIYEITMNYIENENDRNETRYISFDEKPVPIGEFSEKFCNAWKDAKTRYEICERVLEDVVRTILSGIGETPKSEDVKKYIDSATTDKSANPKDPIAEVYEDQSKLMGRYALNVFYEGEGILSREQIMKNVREKTKLGLEIRADYIGVSLIRIFPAS